MVSYPFSVDIAWSKKSKVKVVQWHVWPEPSLTFQNRPFFTPPGHVSGFSSPFRRIKYCVHQHEMSTGELENMTLNPIVANVFNLSTWKYMSAKLQPRHRTIHVLGYSLLELRICMILFFTDTKVRLASNFPSKLESWTFFWIVWREPIRVLFLITCSCNGYRSLLFNTLNSL